jgi:hypothetical protein
VPRHAPVRHARTSAAGRRGRVRRRWSRPGTRGAGGGRRHARPPRHGLRRRHLPLIGLLVALASVPTLIAVLAGAASLDSTQEARSPFVAGTPAGPIVVSAPGDLAARPQSHQPAAAEPARTTHPGGAGAGGPADRSGSRSPESCRDDRGARRRPGGGPDGAALPPSTPAPSPTPHPAPTAAPTATDRSPSLGGTGDAVPPTAVPDPSDDGLLDDLLVILLQLGVLLG